MKSGLLTITEAARDLGVSRPTVAGLIARGELQGHRSVVDRRAVLIRAADLADLRARALVTIGSENGRHRQGATA